VSGGERQRADRASQRRWNLDLRAGQAYEEAQDS